MPFTSSLAKARPGEINYASGGVGSAQHIPMEMLIAATDIKLMHIPYKGLTPALNDAIGGQIPVMFVGLAGAMFVDSTLDKTVCWDGANWRDVTTGAAV